MHCSSVLTNGILVCGIFLYNWQSDMECLSAHRPLRKFGAESEDERQPRRRWGADSEDDSAINAVDRQSKGMRRASSSYDFLQYNNKQVSQVLTSIIQME